METDGRQVRTDRRPRIVVTGLGVVSAIGQSVAQHWQGLVDGCCGIGPLEAIDLRHARIRIGAQIKDFDAPARLRHWRRDKTILLSERVSWLAGAAADEALRQAGLANGFDAAPYRAACVIGSGAGGQISGEKACRDRFLDGKKAVHPMLLPRIIPSSAAAHIGIEFGIKGPTYGVSSAGSSASHAIAQGRDLIASGMVDVAVVGGTDAMLTFGALLAADAAGLLSADGCFPFAERRSGTVLGEGAGVLVLERAEHAAARGATVLAELAGVGCVSGALSMLRPDETAIQAGMQAALADAGIAPRDVDYLNACGSGSLAADRAETRAIVAAFGDHVTALDVSSTKGAHGHTFGASGAIEALGAVCALRAQVMPPTVGLGEIDPECDLRHVRAAGRKEMRTVMTNTIALGSLCVSLVFRSATV